MMIVMLTFMDLATLVQALLLPRLLSDCHSRGFLHGHVWYSLPLPGQPR